MNNLILTLIVKQPILSHLIVLLMFNAGLYCFANHLKFSNFSWVWAGTTVVSALLAQLYFKLQDLKNSSNTTLSELNRLAKSTDDLSKIVLKLLFFHLILGLTLNVVVSFSISHLIVTVTTISVVPVWLISIYFGYMLYKEIANFNALILKRKLKMEQKQSALSKLNQKNNS